MPWYRLECRLRQKFLFLYIFEASLVGNYRADLVVNDCVLLELKAISEHLMLRMRTGSALSSWATRFEVGLLLNFGPRAAVPPVHTRGRQEKKVRVVPRESAVEALRDC